jgi:16S rRNA processing protein RimM
MSPDDWVPLGRVVRAHGIKGEVRLMLDGDGDVIVPGLVIQVGGKPQVVASVRLESGIAAFVGITDRTTAEGLRGQTIAVQRKALPELEDEEVYLADVVDLPVLDTTGRRLGVIIAFTDNTAQPLAIVRVDDGGHQALVPFVAPIVVEVRDDAVILSPPAGLLDPM